MQSAADRGMQPAGASAIEPSRALLRDATEELASCWDPFAAMDLSVAMLEAQKAGLDDLSPGRPPARRSPSAWWH